MLVRVSEGSSYGDLTVLVLLAAILDLIVTTTPILPFGECNVIMHTVYCEQRLLLLITITLSTLLMELSWLMLFYVRFGKTLCLFGHSKSNARF